MTAPGPIAVVALEIGGPEFVIGDTIAHDEIRDFENLMADGDDRSLVPAMPLAPEVPRLQRRVLRPHRGLATFDQGAAQIAVALARLSAAAFPCALVLTRTHRRPAAQMAGGRKMAHVTGRLDEDRHRVAPGDPGNR